MNFDFSDDEKRLKEEAHSFLTDRCPPKAVRRVLEGELPFDRDLWRGVAELGWTGAAIPEAYGGVGLGHVGLCAVAEELGAALAVPSPVRDRVCAVWPTSAAIAGAVAAIAAGTATAASRAAASRLERKRVMVGPRMGCGWAGVEAGIATLPRQVSGPIGISSGPG